MIEDKIRMLAEQADAYADAIDIGGKNYIGLRDEYFAELIVKECMELISNESEKVNGEWRCKDGLHIWWKVKEHFGVKE